MRHERARENYIKRFYRMDVEDDEEGGEEKNGGRERGKSPAPQNPAKEEHHYHGNTRLPYGLCKGLGIDTTGMRPREAWDALRRGYGIKPSDVYDYVDEHGSLDGFNNKENMAKTGEEGTQATPKTEEPKTENPKVPEAPKEPKVEEPKPEPKDEPVNPTAQANHEEEPKKEPGPKEAPQKHSLHSEDLDEIDYYHDELKYWISSINVGKPYTTKGAEGLLREEPHFSYGLSCALRTASRNFAPEYDKDRRLAQSTLAAKDGINSYIQAAAYLNICERALKKNGKEPSLQAGLLKDNAERMRKALDDMDEASVPQIKNWLQRKCDEFLSRYGNYKKQVESVATTAEAFAQTNEEAIKENQNNSNYGASGIRTYKHFDNVADAQDYISKQLSGISVDYGRLQKYMSDRGLETKFNGRNWWDGVNDTLMSVWENCGVAPKKINTSNHCKSAIASWTVGDQHLNLCAVKEIKSRAAEVEEYTAKKAEIEEYLKKLKTLRDFGVPGLNHDIAKAESYIEYCDRNIKSRYNVKDDDYLMESVIVHELGHGVIDKLDEKYSAGTGRSYELKIWNAFASHPEDYEKISRYAFDLSRAPKKGQELFAECFAMYNLPNEREKLPQYAVDIIEEALDKIR